MSTVNDEQAVTRSEFEALSAALERLDSKFTSKIAEMDSHLCKLEKDMHKIFGIKQYVDIGISFVLGWCWCVWTTYNFPSTQIISTKRTYEYNH